MADPTAVAFTDFLGEMLRLGSDALESTPFGRPPALIIQHGSPPEDRHSLNLWIESWTPIRHDQFPQPFQGSEPRAKVWASMMPSITLSLRRPCAPMPTDNAASPFPRPEAITEHAMAMSHDATALACKFQPAVEQYLKSSQPTIDARIAWGSLTPSRGGDLAGWSWRFVVEWGCGCG